MEGSLGQQMIACATTVLGLAGIVYSISKEERPAPTLEVEPALVGG